jgi:hypothetical protein
MRLLVSLVNACAVKAVFQYPLELLPISPAFAMYGLV